MFNRIKDVAEQKQKEDGIISIVRLNQLWKRKEIVKKWKIGRLTIKFEWRSSKNLWGRFGGGWNWELGFLASRYDVVINLLICSLRFMYDKKKNERKG